MMMQACRQTSIHTGGATRARTCMYVFTGTLVSYVDLQPGYECVLQHNNLTPKLQQLCTTGTIADNTHVLRTYGYVCVDTYVRTGTYVPRTYTHKFIIHNASSKSTCTVERQRVFFHSLGRTYRLQHNLTPPTVPV